jgi:hypothetical protein
MAYVAVSNSPIYVQQTGHPDQGLPGVPPQAGQGPGFPTHPIAPGGPVDPGYGYPLPPVTEYPTPGPILPPGYPSGQPVPPTYPVDPNYGLPTPPTVWPMPPRPERPDNSLPPIQAHPSHPIYIPNPGAPDNELPLPPGSVWPPLPPGVEGQVMCIVWIVGVGYRWTVIDTELQPEHPMVPPAAHPDQGLPGGGRPNRPSQGLPPAPGRPDQGLPPTEAQPRPSQQPSRGGGANPGEPPAKP